MNRLEIWNPEKWNTVLTGVEADPETFVSQLQDLGI